MSSTFTRPSDTERRVVTVPIELAVEKRSDGQLRLSGVAVPYDSPSEDLGFREVILPGAFRRTLEQHPDVLLYFGHDNTLPLARTTAGNLKLREDTRGLAFEAELPETTMARDALTLVRSGVVHQMSFAFTMRDGVDRWEQKLGEDWRYIESIGELHEISLVTSPAYSSSSVAARSTTQTRGRLARRPQSPYRPDGEFSWFRDMMLLDTAPSITKTDATPTAAENFAAIGDLVKQTGDAYGAMPSALLMAPRRIIWVLSTLGYNPTWPVEPTPCPAIRTTLGASTNEDEVFAIVAGEIPLYLDPPKIRVRVDHAGSNTLQVKVVATIYAALLAGRKPPAIGRMSGTSLTNPVF